MKFRQYIFLFAALTVISGLVACGGSGGGGGTTTPAVSITVTSGSPQSAVVSAAFAAPLVATVTTGGTPTGGVTVTFAAPASGASGAFAGGVNTATTNSSGVATSPIFTANATPGTYAVTATVSGASTPASFALTNTAGTPASITANSGSEQSAVAGAAFASPLVAKVLDSNSNPVSGASVVFTAPPSGASGTFSTSGTATETDSTDANGLATSSAFTANTTVGGPYTVTATVSGVSTPANFSLSNTTPPPIVVSLAPRPASLQLSTGAGITALVANDLQNAGVSWMVTCGSAGVCGSLSAPNTPSGVATDFTAPAAIPTGNTVTITATSLTDPTKFATATITVTSANTALANGTYVFSLGGTNANNGGPYYVGGAFTISGTTITGGEQDYIDLVNFASDTISGGSITTTPDGNLLITLNTTDLNVGVNGVETLDATQISATRARVMEFDTNRTSSGRVDMQTSVAAPSAGWAFFAAGPDGASTPAPVAIGGVINIDGSGTISGAGSVFDINDGSNTSGPQADQAFSSSTVSPPDSFGRVVFGLVPSAASAVPAISLVGYIVDTTHIRLVETSDAFAGSMGGIAIGQGANTGAFSSSSIAGNSYVPGLTGFDTTGVLQVAGVLTTNADGVSVGGAINYNDLTGSGPETPSSISGGSYTVDPTGRVTMTSVTDGTVTYNLQLYLSGDGPEGEITAISMDNGDILAGIGWQQTGGGAFAATSMFGNYTLYATGTDNSSAENVFNAIGPLKADGIGTLTGTADINSFAAVGGVLGQPVTGTFAANANGAFTGSLTGLDVTTNTNQDVFSYYIVDATKVFAIETDSNQLTLGFFALQQ